MTRVFELRPARGPLLISVPHAGTRLPHALEQRMTPLAKTLPDTDWFVDRLWDFGHECETGLLAARYSRYVVDLNRPPDDSALYAGAGTGLVPETTFAGEPLYRTGDRPGHAERMERVAAYFRPYHEALGAELERIRARHGHALLLDAHSIRHRVPRLFDGELPDLNLGTHRGASASRTLIDRAAAVMRRWPDLTSVIDGRFTGGYITRHYGAPAQGIHALQLEMAQRVYMVEDPPAMDRASTESVRGFIRDLLDSLLTWCPQDD